MTKSIAQRIAAAQKRLTANDQKLESAKKTLAEKYYAGERMVQKTHDSVAKTIQREIDSLSSRVKMSKDAQKVFYAMANGDRFRSRSVRGLAVELGMSQTKIASILNNPSVATQRVSRRGATLYTLLPAIAAKARGEGGD